MPLAHSRRWRDRAIGRDIVDPHYKECLYAGIGVSCASLPVESIGVGDRGDGAGVHCNDNTKSMRNDRRITPCQGWVVAGSGLSLKDELNSRWSFNGTYRHLGESDCKGDITGGESFTDNIPRVVPDDLGAVGTSTIVQMDPTVKCEENLGIGMIMMVTPDAVSRS
ncbi:unnamed protein product [Microthlaspi erraticum]|uniref:Uncharacterized protein n=1 Tax=Microthlaspi erraticum TaxID=1685480 RepID=A0A6D2I3T7_9BRAS|nr:unnamed protein product [Microthlaspi erraticum]